MSEQDTSSPHHCKNEHVVRWRLFLLQLLVVCFLLQCIPLYGCFGHYDFVSFDS